MHKTLFSFVLLWVCAGSVMAGQQGSPKASTATDISPTAIRHDLERRHVISNHDTSANDIVSALASYDFQTRNGSNLNSNGEETKQALADLNKSLAVKKLQSRVRVSTHESGARIWYQLIGSGQPTAFGGMTNNATEDLPIGIYLIWSERQGRKTSVAIPFRVINPQFSIDIEEQKQ
jgi:hypothetical protein